MNGPGIIRPRQRLRNPAVPSYTIIAVGQRCVGKSSLLRLLLDTLPLSPHATHDQLRSVANFVSSPNSFCECHLEVLWHNERLLLHLIDTPPLTGDDTLAEIISVVEERYIRGAQSDSDEGDSALGESHVHLCLYLLDALQPDFHDDISIIGRLSVRVNVLPILARSDVLTLNGLINFKQSIRARLADAGLGFGIFDKQGEAGAIPTRHSAIEPPRNLPLLPYAIFTPEHSKSAYEPVLNLWMDKLDKYRAESDTKMDVDRKIDEPSPASLSSSSSSISVGRHLTKPASSRGSSSPAPASEQDHPAHKSDHDAVTQANNNDTTTNPTTTFSTISALTDDKPRPRTPPIANQPVPAQSSSPQSSAMKDNFGTVRIKADSSQQAPNAEDSAAAARIEAEVQNAHNSGRPNTTIITDRPLSASSPQNGLHSDVKISPSIDTIPLDPKISTTPTPGTATATSEAPCFTEQKNQNLKCDAGLQNTVSSVSNDSELTMEKFVRIMRWGMLDCIDNRQSDFVRLRDEIMSWRKELKAYTRDYLYSRFKDDSFKRVAQRQPPHQRDPPPSSEPTLPPSSRHDNIPRDPTYHASSPPPPPPPPPPPLLPPSSFQHGHGLRDRSTSFTDSAAPERDRPSMSRSMPPYSGVRGHGSYVYECEPDGDAGHRYLYHDRPRDKYLSPEREKGYHAPPPPHPHPHLSPHVATTMPLSNERKHSVSNGDRDRDRPKYRDPTKHDHDWEEQQRHHPVLPSIDRGDRYARVSPITHVPPPLPAHCHPGPYPPQYGSDHITRDKEHFERDRDRGREKISPSIRERDIITPPLQRSGSPGASGTPIGVPTGQHGQVYGSNVVNPNISPTIASGGKQLDVHSLLNHNSHHGAVPGIISQGLEKEWERRERERELSPNSATLQSSGVPLGMPISNMPMSSGPQAGNVVGPTSSANNISPVVSVSNVGPNSTGRKRKITMACNFCRSRKLKCDGLKPTCGQCTKRGNTCDYQQHATVAPQGPSTVPKDVPMNPSSQSRDHLAGQPNAILPPTHVGGGQLTSPGLRHREREYGREMERDRDGSYYHSGRPYSPPGPPPLPPPPQQQHGGPGQSQGHPYPQQGYPSSSNYPRMREGSPQSQHHVNAHGATHTWRYTSQSHAQAHAAATRDSDVDELIEDLSEHEERNSDNMRSRGMKSGHRDFTHVVYEQTNGPGGMNSTSANGRGRVSVDMLIVEALGEGSSSNGPLEDDNRTGPAAIGANGGRNRDGMKDSDKGQQHVSQPPNQAQPPSSGPGGHYESGSWYEINVGVIDVGSEGDKKKRLNRQSANYGSKAVACVHCRARKTRCDAVRPACGNCARRSLACSYNHTTPSQPRSKGKKAAAAAAAAASSNSNSNNLNSGSVPAMTPNGVIDHDMKLQRSNVPSHPSRSPNHSRSPGQIGTPHPLPSWHHASQSRQNHPHSHPHPHPHSRSSHSSSHSPIRVDDHRLPIEESAERERPLTRSPQPPIATLNVPERSRSRSSSSGSLSTSLMENGTHSNNNNNNNGSGGSITVPISRSRSTSNFTGANLPEFAGAKRKSPDVAVELMDAASIERGIIPDERGRERPDKRRKAWVENTSGDAAHLSNQVRVQ